MSEHPLEFYAGSCTGNSFGGGPVAFVGMHLTLRAPLIQGPARSLWVDIHYRWIGRPRCHRSVLSSVEDHHAAMERLPKRRFMRSKGEMTIDWPAGRMNADTVFDLYRQHMTPDHFDAAFDDLLGAVDWAFGRLKPADGIDGPAIMEWLRAVRSEDRGDTDALQRMLQADSAAEEAARKARLAADPWSIVDVDWDRVPDKARAVLDQPSDWSLSDDFAPHGTDTGADMLADWRRYSRDRVLRAAQRLMDNDRSLTPDDDPNLYLEVALALAFGHLKKTGAVPAQIIADTREALAKALETPEDFARPEFAGEWVGRMRRYDAILGAITP